MPARSIALVFMVLSGVFVGPLQAAGGLAPQGKAGGHMGVSDQVLETARQSAAQNPESARAPLELARLYLSQRQYQASISQFQRAIGLNPSDATAFAGLGLAYLHMGRYGPAHAALSEVVRLDPAKSEVIAPLLARIEERTGGASVIPGASN